MLYNNAMNVVNYLKETYGYSVPIFLRDIRIGRKSKTAIRKELSRAVQKGEIVRKSNGVYYLEEDTDIPRTVSFEEIIEKKYIKDDYGFPGLNVVNTFGYYTGQMFKNYIGISTQVPAVVEIVTNNTSCKRIITINSRRAIIKKPKAEINYNNYKILQFLDLINTLDNDEIKEHKDTLYQYIRNNFIRKNLDDYLDLYPLKVYYLLLYGGLLNAFGS